MAANAAASAAIGMALAGKSASVDIPKPRDEVFHPGRDSLTAVSASASAKKQHAMLPTPPNSISPVLPPHHRRDRRASPTSRSTSHVDPDVDLHHPVDPLQAAADQTQRNILNAEALDSLGDLNSAEAITPGMLAKHHLPDILLTHGPLAIRHIMGYLTTSVPGFSRITPAKARRLVVAALEGRGSGTELGPPDGDVVFDKVGWGRWDARVKGQPPRDRAHANITPPGSLPSSYSHPGLQIPGQRSWPSGSDHLGSSVAGNSAIFSQSEMDDEDHDMLEHEADKMSLDGDDDYASSEAPEPLMDEDLGDGDLTDEEDWASIGAAALRARSLPSAGRVRSGGGRLYQPIASYSTTYRRRSRTRTPAAVAAQSLPSHPVPVHNSKFSLPAGAGVNDSQERAAIEALLSLGSM